MTFAAIVSGLFSVAKAVPVVAKYIDMFFDMYMDRQIQKARKEMHEQANKRATLMQSIQKATTDEERISLSIILSDISR